MRFSFFLSLGIHFILGISLLFSGNLKNIDVPNYIAVNAIFAPIKNKTVLNKKPKEEKPEKPAPKQPLPKLEPKEEKSEKPAPKQPLPKLEPEEEKPEKPAPKQPLPKLEPEEEKPEKPAPKQPLPKLEPKEEKPEKPAPKQPLPKLEPKEEKPEKPAPKQPLPKLEPEEEKPENQKSEFLDNLNNLEILVESKTEVYTNEQIEEEKKISLTDLIRTKINQCWYMPIGTPNDRKLIVEIHISLDQEGHLIEKPEIIDIEKIHARDNSYLIRAAEQAVQAVEKCAPYQKLPVTRYEEWKEITIRFIPDSF